MPKFVYTQAAESDLLDIWLYSCEKWNASQADRYLRLLDEGCQRIGDGEAVTSKKLMEIDPYLMVYRCAHHYIFYLTDSQPIKIIAFFHESMDVLHRVQSRL